MIWLYLRFITFTSIWSKPGALFIVNDLNAFENSHSVKGFSCLYSLCWCKIQSLYHIHFIILNQHSFLINILINIYFVILNQHISFFNGNYGYNVYIFLPEYLNSEFLNILLDRENFIEHAYYLLLHPVISSHITQVTGSSKNCEGRKRSRKLNWWHYYSFHFEIICWQLFVTFRYLLSVSLSWRKLSELLLITQSSVLETRPLFKKHHNQIKQIDKLGNIKKVFFTKQEKWLPKLSLCKDVKELSWSMQIKLVTKNIIEFSLRIQIQKQPPEVFYQKRCS